MPSGGVSFAVPGAGAGEGEDQPEDADAAGDDGPQYRVLALLGRQAFQQGAQGVGWRGAFIAHLTPDHVVRWCSPGRRLVVLDGDSGDFTAVLSDLLATTMGSVPTFCSRNFSPISPRPSYWRTQGEAHFVHSWIAVQFFHLDVHGTRSEAIATSQSLHRGWGFGEGPAAVA